MTCAAAIIYTNKNCCTNVLIDIRHTAICYPIYNLQYIEVTTAPYLDIYMIKTIVIFSCCNCMPSQKPHMISQCTSNLLHLTYMEIAHFSNTLLWIKISPSELYQFLKTNHLARMALVIQWFYKQININFNC